MKKSLLLTLSAGCVLVASTAFRPGNEMVEVEITNPCTRMVSCGWARELNPTASTNNGFSVDPGKSRKISVPKGAYLKFARKNEFTTTMLGKVEYKGQRFACDCQ